MDMRYYGDSALNAPCLTLRSGGRIWMWYRPIVAATAIEYTVTVIPNSCAIRPEDLER